MMVSPRLLLAACTIALALPASASAGLFGHGDGSCAAPGYVDYGCAPTCAAPCGDVCAPTCAAPVYGDVCAPMGCCESYCCPPRESCLKRFGRKIVELEHRKNAWLLSKLHGLCHHNDCCETGCVDYCCEPTCAAPCGDVCGDICAPSCGAPVYGELCSPTCAAPCGDVCAPTCAAPVCGY
ncbi:hypothetical protein [Alienimonas californiensis]|uniref:Stigma-specific protein, Stig1 n=1 Tax=Alienimonas californiensis TaxID=2527989 RepID=A0A517PAN3_9PLAN|nr:hypothetical protein [Alienimonas californiensis]QDT16426.1 hypothetical protein CA12_25280 [Alienimonas californiensis]